jgi:hypothetical protein
LSILRKKCTRSRARGQVPKNGLTAPPEPAPAAGTIPKLIAMAPAAYRNTALTARVVMTLCNLSVRNFRSAKLNIHVVSCTRNLFTLLRPTFFLFKQWRYFCFVAGKGPPERTGSFTCALHVCGHLRCVHLSAGFSVW